jgi:hypothetical protein
MLWSGGVGKVGSRRVDGRSGRGRPCWACDVRSVRSVREVGMVRCMCVRWRLRGELVEYVLPRDFRGCGGSLVSLVVGGSCLQTLGRWDGGMVGCRVAIVAGMCLLRMSLVS